MNENERQRFNKNNFETIILTKEKVVALDLEKTIIKKDEFYEDFLEFICLNGVMDLKFKMTPEKIIKDNDDY